MAPKSRFFCESAKNRFGERPMKQLDSSLVGLKFGKHQWKMAILSRFWTGNPYNGSPQKRFRLEGALGPPRPEFRDQVKVSSFLFFINIIFRAQRGPVFIVLSDLNLKVRTQRAVTPWKSWVGSGFCKFDSFKCSFLYLLPLKYRILKGVGYTTRFLEVLGKPQPHPCPKVRETPPVFKSRTLSVTLSF